MNFIDLGRQYEVIKQSLQEESIVSHVAVVRKRFRYL